MFNSQSLLRFTYVQNNPGTRIDPTGFQDTACCTTTTNEIAEFFYTYDFDTESNAAGPEFIVLWGSYTAAAGADKSKSNPSQLNEDRATSLTNSPPALTYASGTEFDTEALFGLESVELGAQERGCGGRPCIDRSGGPLSPEDVLKAIETIETASDIATGVALGVDVALGGPTGEGVLAAGGITVLKKRLINNAMEKLSDYLGPDPKVITNKAGDKIFLSSDNRRRIRFDINNSQGDKPHVHIEIRRNQRWRDYTDQHRIYPRD